MPDLQFLNNVNIQGNETVHGNELITGNETVSGNSYVTENLTISGTTLALDTINLSGNLNATGDENITGNLNVGGVANFAQNINALSGISTTGSVVASAFYGDGSNLTGITTSSVSYLPLSGGTMSGPIAFGSNLYSPRIDQGNYDASRGGLSGLSLICSVDYDFNWQAGWITALEQDRLTPRPLYIDSGAGTTARVWDGTSNTGVAISHTGITFPDGTTQTTASAFSGVLPISAGGTGATDATTARTNLNIADSTEVQVLTSSSTWTKSTSAKAVQFILLGGGGSGQGGGMWDGVTAVAAAAGGGGGGMNDVTFAASSLPASLDVVVGAGGASVAGRTSAGAPVNGNAGLPTILSAGGVTYAYAGPGQGGGTANSGGVYNGNNGATTTTLAGFNMRGGAGGGRGGSLTAGGVAQNGTNGGDGMAGALPGGTVGSGSNTANGSPGAAGALIGNIVGLTVSSGGGGGGTSAFATGVGGAGGSGGGWGTGGGGGGAGKGGGGASGPGSSGFAIIITHF